MVKVNLDSKEEIIAYRAAESIKGLDAIGMIKQYYSSDLPIVLPENVEEIRERLNLVIRLQCRKLSRFNIVNKLVKVFGISQRQAYRDLENALAVFGAEETPKEGHRVIADEMIGEAYRLAKTNGDVKGMLEASKALTKLRGLDREDTEKPDWSNLKQSVYVIVMEPKVDKMFETFIHHSGSIDVSQFITNIAKHAEEVEYTEAGTDRADQE